MIPTLQLGGIGRRYKQDSAPPAGAAVLWNPNDKHADVVLSDSDRQAVNPITTWRSARSFTLPTRYKSYTEIKPMGPAGGVGTTPQMMYGLAMSNSSLTNAMSDNPTTTFTIYGPDGSRVSSGGGGFGVNYITVIEMDDVLGIAYDPESGKIWFSNNGVWVGDPVAGTSPAYTVTNGRRLYVGMSDTGNDSNPAKIQSLASDQSYSPPTGFTRSGEAAPGTILAITWEPTDKDAAITLSNSNLDATNTAGGSHKGARGRALHKTRKSYVEFEPVVGTGTMVGIADQTHDLTSYLGNVTGGTGGHGFALDIASGDKLTGAVGAAHLPASSVGDIIMMAFDPVTRQLWFGRNGTWVGDPAAGTSPAYTVAAGFDYYLGMSGITAGHIARVRPTAGSQSFSPPTGFTALGTA